MDRTDSLIGYSDSVDLKNSDVVYPFLGANSHIEIFSNGKFVFEGKYSIYEFFSDKISVKISKRMLIIIGKRLRLKNVTAQGFTIIGNIDLIEFE